MSTWLVAAGDFSPYGGMDAANHGLASYLAGRPETRLHLVAHAISPDLAQRSAVHVHKAWRPLGAHRLGEPFLRWQAGRWHRRLAATGVHTIANGGNISVGEVVWLHYVHAAYTPESALPRARSALVRHTARVRRETDAVARARLIICNSRRTRRDAIQLLGADPRRTHVVYYGTDPERFRPARSDERSAARAALRIDMDRPVALFVGALGDRRKGFAALFETWRTLCADRAWDVDLMVAGEGAELPRWQMEATAALPPGRIRFLGYHRDVPSLLAASDLLIHPARYEAYGLAVHEALCCGVPALVSASAGVAERYPASLSDLLIPDPDDPAALAVRLRAWRAGGSPREELHRLGVELRKRTWADMAGELADLVETSRVDPR